MHPPTPSIFASFTIQALHVNIMTTHWHNEMREQVSVFPAMGMFYDTCWSPNLVHTGKKKI